MKVNKIINIAELFCGSECFAQGLKRLDLIISLDNHEDSCKSFEKNQKCKSYCEDIREFTKPSYLKQIKKTHGNINGLLFGFPCNDFSLVGKNKKMEGKFGGLYKYACKVLDYFEPEFFVAENVTSLGKKLKHNSSVRKKVKDIFNNEKLQNQNYQNFKNNGRFSYCSKVVIEFMLIIINSKNMSSQTRHRIILVGFREDFFKENKIN